MIDPNNTAVAASPTSPRQVGAGVPAKVITLPPQPSPSRSFPSVRPNKIFDQMLEDVDGISANEKNIVIKLDTIEKKLDNYAKEAACCAALAEFTGTMCIGMGAIVSQWALPWGLAMVSTGSSVLAAKEGLTMGGVVSELRDKVAEVADKARESGRISDKDIDKVRGFISKARRSTVLGGVLSLGTEGTVFER